MSAICPGCGKPVGPDAVQGLCAECMLRVGLGSEGSGAAGQAASPPPAPPAPDQLAAFFPQLEILELLGRGGMGAVYKARQKQLKRLVALKILPPQARPDPAFAERFTREARALASLNHPNIVTLYEFGEANGLFYFLMEFVDGVSLRQLLEAGRLAPREALAIVPQICDALQYAHDQGVVHRDIKPENILLDRRGRVKIADFGLAKLVGLPVSEPGPERAHVTTGLTAAGTVVGTPQYMAPEQFNRPAEVDHRADIYSLGVVFYQMLTGELPGKDMQPPSRKVLLDVRLDEVVLRALERKPELRFQQASEIKSSVENIASTPSPEAVPPPAGGTEKIPRPALLGLAWIALFFINWILSYTPPGWALTALVRGSRLEAVFELLFFLPLMALGFSAPLGAIAMGWLGLREVRKSPGRRAGFGLSLFDLLFWPVAILDYWLLWLGRTVSRQLAQPASTAADSHGSAWIGLALAIPLALALDYFLARIAWRKAKQFVSRPFPAESPRPSGTWGRELRGTLWRFVIVLLAHLALFETLEQASVEWRESTSELWGLALMVATLAGLIWACWPRRRIRYAIPFLVGVIALASFLLLGTVNLYSWHVRLNLGLYRESDWVREIPGFQWEFRLKTARHLWHRPIVPPLFSPAPELLFAPTNFPSLVSFSTGRILTVTNTFPDNHARVACARSNHADLVVYQRDHQLVLEGVDLSVVALLRPLPENHAQDVADFWAMERKGPKPSIALWPAYGGPGFASPRPEEPVPARNYSFRSRNGAMGVLQITNSIASFPLRIRYQLVSRTNAGAPVK